jgi:cell division septation protein DedD
MARDWRRLAIAAPAAAALAMVCAPTAESQAPPKAENAAAKAPAKKKKQDPIEAQRAIDAALKQLEAGKPDQAATALTATLAAGNLPPAMMAKALLYRGIAYRQQNKPAQAIADLTSALWLKGGLSDSDRKDALGHRRSAYQEAGLSESGEPITPAVPPAVARAPAPPPQVVQAPLPASPAQVTDAPPPAAAPPAATRAASATRSWGAETVWYPTGPPLSQGASVQAAPAQPTSQQSGGWNLFGNLFGGSSSPAPPARAPAAAVPTPLAAAPVERAETSVVRRPAQPGGQTATSAWSSSTGTQSHTAPVVTGAVAAKPAGRYRIQVGLVRTQGEADALAARVKQEHGSLLGARDMEIDQAVVGNMGSLYRVRVGPFASQQETNVVCARLKGTGLDCLVVTQ